MAAPLALVDPTTNLPADVLREIVRRIPCIADRDGTPDVCKKWRTALAEAEPLVPSAAPRPLPWLVLPSAGAASTRVCCFYCGDRCNFRSRLSPTHGARYFGSHEGGWIFLAFNQTHGHAIVNLRSRNPRTTRLLALPDRLRSRRDNQCPDDMVILAATLSSSPEDKNCIAAGIVMRWHLIAGPRQFALWRLGDGVAVDGAMAPDALNLNAEVEDLIYHDGAFRFLTSRGAIIVCMPVFYPDGKLQSTSESLLPIWQPERLRELVHARYLVESRGKLLMVVRFTPSPHLHTSELQVFEIVKEVSSFAGIEEVVPSWRELGSLDGRIIFVARGCSRSYELGDLGLKGLEEGIYFLDDSTFYDEPMMFRSAKDRCYPCNDNGKWFDGHLEPCFPEQGPSTHSPPTWVFP